MDLKTRAGISPVETKPKFKITTQGAEEFLQ